MRRLLRAAGSVDTFLICVFFSSLKSELEAARAKADEEARRAREMEQQMEELRREMTQLQQAPPQQASTTSEAIAGESEMAAPAREEFVKMLESSALASKLTEVEALLRTLITQKMSP